MGHIAGGVTRASRGSTVTGVGHINRGVGVPVTGGDLKWLCMCPSD